MSREKSKGLAIAEKEKLFAVRQKIDRIVKLSYSIERLERFAGSSELSGQEGVRNMIHGAVFNLDDSDIRQIIDFVADKMKRTRENMERELAELRPAVGLEASVE